ncbi:hypothetical protein ES702_01939 [subsurface metagenome]
MTPMTSTRSERRKKEIARSILRKKIIYDMKLGLPFETDEGRKTQVFLK